MEVVRMYERPKVAIYCRLSDEDHNKKDPEADSRSIQTQKSMLRDYAHEQGWEIYDIYSDDDYSGADSNRPEYNRRSSALRGPCGRNLREFVRELISYTEPPCPVSVAYCQKPLYTIMKIISTIK